MTVGLLLAAGAGVLVAGGFDGAAGVVAGAAGAGAGAGAGVCVWPYIIAAHKSATATTFGIVNLENVFIFTSSLRCTPGSGV
jgi:uncharacterized spore protein YtfJ